MKKEKKGAVVLHSGGMDSTTLLFEAVEKYGRTNVVSFGCNYGQLHRVELERAEAICNKIVVQRVLINLEDLGLYLTSSCLTNHETEVPHGHYAEESMKLTVVPNRNMILISLAAACSIDWGWNEVWYGAHAGDHDVYPDCRPKFFDLCQDLVNVGNWVEGSEFKLVAPFGEMTKSEIVKRGNELGVPFELTYSCYSGESDSHCGLCSTCVERREAFHLAGVPDPTRYTVSKKETFEVGRISG